MNNLYKTANTDYFNIYKKLPCLLITHCNLFLIKLLCVFLSSLIPVYTDCINLPKIEKVISNLTPEELSQFRAWFEEFYAVTWDKQIEEDVKSGRLDAIAEKAISD